MIRTIAARELRALFLSPLAWLLLAVVVATLGYGFLAQLQQYMLQQAQLATLDSPPGLTEVVVLPLLASAALLMVLVLPVLTMGSISAERRNHTLTLLISAPLHAGQLVLGKYLGLLGFIGVMLGLVALMPLSLLIGGPLDPGLLAAAFLGLALTLAAFTAAGLYLSSLTAQPALAASATLGLLLLFWVVDWAAAQPGASSAAPLLGYLSIKPHFSRLLRGTVDSADIAYFLLFISTFLGLTLDRLNRLREP